MSLSELIAMLERVRAEYGDLPVYYPAQDQSGHYLTALTERCLKVEESGQSYDGKVGKHLRLDT